MEKPAITPESPAASIDTLETEPHAEQAVHSSVSGGELGGLALDKALPSSDLTENDSSNPTENRLKDVLEEADPEKLRDIINGKSDLLDDPKSTAELAAFIIGKLDYDTNRPTRKQRKEFEKLGIIQKASESTKKLIDADTVPGPLVRRLMIQFGLVTKYGDEHISANWGSEVSMPLLLERISNSVEVLSELHEIDPSAPRAIYRIFGIVHFGRYNAEQLMEQLELVRDINNGGEKPNSTIMVATATSDHNGALDTNAVRDHENVIAARKQDPSVPPLIFVEGNDTKVLGQRIHALTQHVAPAAALFINAHGSDEHIFFSNRPSGTIDYRAPDYGFLDDLKTDESLTPGAEICIIACDTGAPFGVAREIARHSRRKVYASSRPLYTPKPYGFKKDSGGNWSYQFGVYHDDPAFGEQHIGHMYDGSLMDPDGIRNLEMSVTSRMIAYARADARRALGLPSNFKVKPSRRMRRIYDKHASQLGSRDFSIHD